MLSWARRGAALDGGGRSHTRPMIGCAMRLPLPHASCSRRGNAEGTARRDFDSLRQVSCRLRHHRAWCARHSARPGPRAPGAGCGCWLTAPVISLSVQYRTSASWVRSRHGGECCGAGWWGGRSPLILGGANAHSSLVSTVSCCTGARLSTHCGCVGRACEPKVVVEVVKRGGCIRLHLCWVCSLLLAPESQGVGSCLCMPGKYCTNGI
jgi:hypothetical protein